MQNEQPQTDPDLILYGDLCREIALARRMTAKLTTRDGHYPGNLGTVANALSRATNAINRLLESDRRAVESPAVEPPAEPKPEQRRRGASAPAESPADYVEAVPARGEAVKLLQKRGPLSVREILDEMKLRLEAPINGQGVGSVLRGLAERNIVRQVQAGLIKKWEINR